MSERYSRLYSLPENLYIEGSPLLIKAGALLKDTQTGKTIAQLKFANICAKTVKAVFVAVDAFDIAGNKLNGVDEYQYLDLAAPRSNEFGQKNAVHLPDPNTRTITCKVIKVFFADNSVWEAPENANWESLKEKTLRKPLEDYELEKQFHIEYGENFKYEFEAVKDLWYCTCGAINHKEEELCHTCKKSFAKYANLDIAALEEKKTARLEKERIAAEEKAEKEKRIAEEAAAKAKKTKKLLAIILPVIAVIIAAIIIVNSVIIPNSKYNAAVKLMESGNYEEAISAFEALDGHKDSVNKIDECNSAMLDVTYIEAIALMNAGNYKEAAAKFSTIDAYKDSLTLLFQCNTKIIGNKIEFGTLNSKQPIVWTVADTQGDKALLICDYIVAEMDFDQNLTASYAASTIRAWLNEQFYSSSFTETEKDLILQSEIYDNYTKVTTDDNVFLLSKEDVEKYCNESNGQSIAPCLANLPNTEKRPPWWIRTAGDTFLWETKNEMVLSPMVVSLHGEIHDGFLFNNQTFGVRPAMWIDISE